MAQYIEVTARRKRAGGLLAAQGAAALLVAWGASSLLSRRVRAIADAAGARVGKDSVLYPGATVLDALLDARASEVQGDHAPQDTLRR